MSILIRIPGRDRRILGETSPTLTVGRSPRNDLVIEDPSISRHHARFDWRDGAPWVTDLGSMNGTQVNGVQISASVPLGPEDKLRLGHVNLLLEGFRQPSVLIEAEPSMAFPQPTLVVPVAALRDAAPPVEQGREPLVEALQLLSDVTLELLRDTSLEKHLDLLLERLFTFLKPSRAAVLLRNPDGRLDPVAMRGFTEGAQIRLSRTLVEAALERREAMLLNDLAQDAKLKNAASLVLSGVTSVMTSPLEHEGEVAGLLYVDARLDRKPFTREDLRLLAGLAHVAAAKIRTVRLQEEVAVKRAMAHEFEIARQIQQKLLPAQPPVLAGYEILGSHRACWEVSGDLYGFWPGPGGRLLFTIADVSGKGVGPGLLMAALQAYLGAWADSEASMGELARRLSCALAERTDVNRFVTAFLGRLEPSEGDVEYTNAGHNPALLLRRDGILEPLESQGIPLALLPGEPYPTGQVRLDPGDLLVLYTDGISEATDPGGCELGIEALAAILRDHAEGSLGQAAKKLEEALSAFTAGAPLSDDRTLLMIRRLPA